MFGLFNKKTKVINISTDFSKYPLGRYRRDSNSSAEEFRDDFLIPALVDNNYKKVIVKLDDTNGYSSSFLEEVFFDLPANTGLGLYELKKKLILKSTDMSIILEIYSYIYKRFEEELFGGVL